MYGRGGTHGTRSERFSRYGPLRDQLGLGLVAGLVQGAWPRRDRANTHRSASLAGPLAHPPRGKPVHSLGKSLGIRSGGIEAAADPF